MSRGDVLRRLDTPVVPGAVYGSLTVLRLVREERRSGAPVVRYWLCRCTCGREEEIAGKRLRFDGWEECARCRHRKKTPGVGSSSRLDPEILEAVLAGVRARRPTIQILEQVREAGGRCSPQLVNYYRRALGIPVEERGQGSKLPADERDLLLQVLREMGDAPRREVEEALRARGVQVGITTINRWRRELGLPSREGRCSLPREQAAALEAAIREGRRTKDIEAELGVTRVTIAKYRRQMDGGA